MRYLVIGAGGTGGLIGGFLANMQHNVTVVARGNQLNVIKEKGLTIIQDHLNETFTVDVNVAEAKDINEVFDVVFICVKEYGLEDIYPLLRKTCTAQTFIIPILNSLNAGNKIRQVFPEFTIFDGGIYVAGSIVKPGTVMQSGEIFKIVYGVNGDAVLDKTKQEALRTDLVESGIDIIFSREITTEIFKKLSFTSVFGGLALFKGGLTAEDIKYNNEYRMLFTVLLKELLQIAYNAGLQVDDSLIKRNLTILDNLTDSFTTSMQKDIESGRQDEREQLIFDFIRLADKYNAEVPNFKQVADYLGFYNTAEM